MKADPINEARLIDGFIELVGINGPSRSERPVADYLKNEFSRLGLEAEEDGAAEQFGGDCGNLLVRFPAENPESEGLIICAHLDTILPTDRLEVVEKDGVFYSAGETILGADNRAGVAAMLECARVLTEEGGSPIPLEFLFTVGEEAGLLGAKALQPGWLRGKLLYVLDSDGPIGKIVNRAPYGVKIAVTVKGKAAHAGIDPESGVNAITVAARAIASMNLGRIDEVTTANIGTITGGTAQNIVPDLVDAIGEVRSLEEERLRKQVSQMEERFRTAAREAGGEIVFYSTFDYAGYSFSRKSPPVTMFSRALKRLGIEAEMEASCGASDANILTGLGIPSLVLSIGYRHPHTSRESQSRAELVRGARLVYELIHITAETQF